MLSFCLAAIAVVVLRSLFSKLALLLRQRLTAFGHDVQITVRCLQTLVQAIDARFIILCFSTMLEWNPQRTDFSNRPCRLSRQTGPISSNETSNSLGPCTNKSLPLELTVPWPLPRTIPFFPLLLFVTVPRSLLSPPSLPFPC